MLLENSVKYIDRPTRGKVITVASLRGGSGTTITATMIASLLSNARVVGQEGKLNVVVVDMSEEESQYLDIYGESTFNSKSLLEASERNYWELSDQTVLDHVVYSPELGNFALLGTDNLKVFSGLGDDGWRDIIEVLVNRFDVVILDYQKLTMPSPTLRVVSMASDEIVLVSNYRNYTLKEFQSFMDKVKSEKPEYNGYFFSEDFSKFSVILNQLTPSIVAPNTINEVPVIGKIRNMKLFYPIFSNHEGCTDLFRDSFVDTVKSFEPLLGVKLDFANVLK